MDTHDIAKRAPKSTWSIGWSLKSIGSQLVRPKDKFQSEEPTVHLKKQHKVSLKKFLQKRNPLILCKLPTTLHRKRLPKYFELFGVFFGARFFHGETAVTAAESLFPGRVESELREKLGEMREREDERKKLSEATVRNSCCKESKLNGIKNELVCTSELRGSFNHQTMEFAG